MITSLRHMFVDSWLGRVIAIAVFVAFIGWGVGDVVGYIGTSSNVVVQVGKTEITVTDLSTALRQEMPVIVQQIGANTAEQLSPGMIQQITQQILQRLIMRAELLEFARTMNIVVPDSAVRNEIFSLPYFQGSNGQFDRAIFNQKLQEQGLTEQAVIRATRNDLTIRAVLQPIVQSGHVSETLLQNVMNYIARVSVVDIARVPFGQFPIPADPGDAVLHRYYVNHPWLFRIPEQRHARIVVLSPDTLARSIPVDEKQLKQIYEAQSATYHTPETRDVHMVILSEEKQAQTLQAAWQKNKNWQDIQHSVKSMKQAEAIDMPATRASAMASDVLRKAVFQAPIDQISPVIKLEGSWAVFCVTKITPPHNVSYTQARPTLLSEYRKEMVASLMPARQRTLQDTIAGSGFEAIPDTLGAVAVSGVLDAQGMTTDGYPAPIPASGALRAAIIHQIFTQKQGASPYLIQGPEKGPENSYFAVEVDKIIPASEKSFTQSRAEVLKAWQNDVRYRMANQEATSLYVASNTSGKIVLPASSKVHITRNVAFLSSMPNKAIPLELMAYLPHMRVGQAIMVQSNHAFLVGFVTKIFVPHPPLSQKDKQKLRLDLTQSESDDLVTTFVQTLIAQTPPSINKSGITMAIARAGLGG
ncbi:MAG: SurA N-terminal domain-containing protein [Acetobacter sp.]|nr:SurA N-terminal domain-containing protein [Acetobacter sp.]